MVSTVGGPRSLLVVGSYAGAGGRSPGPAVAAGLESVGDLEVIRPARVRTTSTTTPKIKRARRIQHQPVREKPASRTRLRGPVIVVCDSRLLRATVCLQACRTTESPQPLRNTRRRDFLRL